MATKYFGSELGRSSQLPFFSDWYNSLSDKEKEFYEGWKFVVFDLRYQSKSGKGWFMDTLKFTTFLFKSHPFVKILTEEDFQINLRNQALCVEVTSTEEWGYKFCLVDVAYCEWEEGKENNYGVVCKGMCVPDEQIIINGLPPTVPSVPSKQTKKKSPTNPRG